ncbi:MAG: hypothetical protein R6U98_17460 [Pirellulaceae bacterium]
MGSHPIRVIGEIRGEMSLLTYCRVDNGSMGAGNDVMGAETTDGSDSTDEGEAGVFAYTSMQPDDCGHSHGPPKSVSCFTAVPKV